jgi:hypothetical protein
LSDLPKDPLPDISQTLEEIERRKARALEQMRQFAALAEEMERDKAQLEEIAARLAAKYGNNTFRVDGKPIAALPSSTHRASSFTVSELIALYHKDVNSPYKKLTHNSRENYDALLGPIEREYGSQSVDGINAAMLQEWYEKWKAGNKTAIARSKMVLLRSLFSFGFGILANEDCARLAGIVNNMTIEVPKARTERLTREQANMIRAKAHERKRSSIALAQAFQSDADLMQKDVIGEWLPVAEPGISDVFLNGLKWVRGIRWEEIDENLILDHPASGKDKIDLKKAPMIMEELGRVRDKNGGTLPASGPIIVSEFDDLPWTPPEFRRWWRMLADECGVPKKVRNSDSRVKASTATIDSRKGKSYLDGR